MIHELPPELITLICSHVLDLNILNSFRGVCHYFNDILCNPTTWKDMISPKILGETKQYPQSIKDWQFVYQVHCLLWDTDKSFRRTMSYLPFHKILRMKSQAMGIIRLKNVALINGFLKHQLSKTHKPQWLTRNMINNITFRIVAGIGRPQNIQQKAWDICTNELGNLLEPQVNIQNHHNSHMSYDGNSRCCFHSNKKQLIEDLIGAKNGPRKDIFYYTITRGLRCGLRSPGLSKKHKLEINLLLSCLKCCNTLNN